MKFSRIRAVDNVVREAASGLDEALRWFYVEVAGLEEVEPALSDSRLCFHSNHLRLEIRLTANPRIELTGFPVVIAVPSLAEARERLAERSVASETICGISWPDRRLATSDPAGNRVELKRDWPYDPL